MRSFVLAAVLGLAGCEQQADDPLLAPTEAASEVAAAAPIVVPAPKSVTEPKPAKRLQALGTEPFWSVEVTPDALVYTTPENLEGTRIAYTLTKVANDARYFGKLGNDQVILLIIPGKCSDGMSDTIYPYSATWSIGAEIHGGCARIR